MRTRLLMFMSNKSGATAVEYALMGLLLALALVIVVVSLSMRGRAANPLARIRRP